MATTGYEDSLHEPLEDACQGFALPGHISTPARHGRMIAVMSSVDELAQDAAKLPDDQKVALANRILEQAEGPRTSEVDAVWDQEIRDRVRAYDETRPSTRPSTRAASDVFRRVDARLRRRSRTNE
jgi:hypothetical protein